MNHSFDIHLADEFGVEEAILIHHFQHWIRINLKLKRNIHEGKAWTYQTQEEIAAHFPYLKNRLRVKRLIDKLIKKGILISKNFNKHQYDRTFWYTLNDRFYSDLNSKVNNESEEQRDCSEMNNEAMTEECSFSNNEKIESEQPIPDTKPDTKTTVCSVDKENLKNEELANLKSEVLRRALKDNEQWSVPECEEAWQIFITYPNGVTDPYKFIKKTVHNLRDNKKKLEKNNNKGPKKWNTQKQSAQSSSKPKSSDKSSHVNLYDLWEAQGT